MTDVDANTQDPTAAANASAPVGVAEEPRSAPPPATAGWVLYDDHCGFCRKWVPGWETTLAKRGIGIAPLQVPWVSERIPLPRAELIDDLRLLLPDGKYLSGADVYRHCAKKIWWAWPVWLFAVLPGGRQLFDWSYATFARNRYCISDACRLPGADEDE